MSSNESIPEMDKSGLQLKTYWRIVWDNRWMVSAVCMAVFCIVALTTFLSTPIYRAEATINIEARARRITPVREVASPGLSGYSWLGEERYYSTQFEIIRSRSVCKSVVDKLDLRNQPGFKDQPDPVASFIKLVRVEPVSDTGIVKIAIQGANPREITRWVNVLIDSYVDRNLDQAVDDTRRAVRALLEELDPLRARVLETESARLEYAQSAQVYVPKDNEKAFDQRLKKLEAQHTEAAVKRLELEAVFNKIEEIARKGGSYLTLPQVSKHETIRNLIADYIRIEKDINRLLVSFKKSHPRLIEKYSELKQIEGKLDEEANHIISGIRTEYALNRDRERSLASEIARTKNKSLRAQLKTSSYQTLASDATESRRLFEMLNRRLQEVSLNSELLSNNIRILDRAVVPSVPIRPRKALNLLIGMVLGIGLGVGCAFFLDYLDHTIKSTEDVEQYLKLSALAVIPREDADTVKASKEGFQTLRTSILFTSRNRIDRVILLTSSGPREGKTTTAINLAKTLAGASDRVCVVDCDLRRPMLHAHLNVRRQHGLTNYLMSNDEAGWRGFVKKTDWENVEVITCGAIPPNPPQVFGGEKFIRLLQTLKSSYDWVILDSPPAASLTDAMILAAAVDMVILVVRYQRVDRDLIRRTTDSLRGVNKNVVGAVLNDVDPDRSYYKSYYDYSYYLDDEVPKREQVTEPHSVAG